MHCIPVPFRVRVHMGGVARSFKHFYRSVQPKLCRSSYVLLHVLRQEQVYLSVSTHTGAAPLQNLWMAECQAGGGPPAAQQRAAACQ